MNLGRNCDRNHNLVEDPFEAFGFRVTLLQFM